MGNTEGANNPWGYFGGNNANIDTNFENMDDLESKTKYPSPIKSQYTTLYDELLAKCDFTNFSGDEEMATKANKIYGQLRKIQDKNSTELISIRNEAIVELGITISTEEKYNYLTKYCNPSLFKNPYNEEMVNKAIHFESRIKQNADNIIELERIENEAQMFIQDAKYLLVKARVKDYPEVGDFNDLSYYVSQSILKDKMIMKYHMRDIFDLLIFRVNYYTAIKMLSESFLYDNAEKDYYTRKMMGKALWGTNIYDAIAALTEAKHADTDNEQCYNMIIQKLNEKEISNRKTNWNIFLVIIGTILIAIIALCIFPH